MRLWFVQAMAIALAVGGADIVRAQAPADGDNVDPVAVAAREARNGWSARTVRTGDATVFPYGRVQPIVTCAPLRACVVALEPGEIVQGKASGDAERWLIDQTTTGPGGKTTLIVIKPTACSLVTNLVVSTDRRVYDLSLASPPCGTRAGGADAEYTRMVRFYYPDPLLMARTGTDSVPPLTADHGDHTRPEALNFGYAISSDKRVRWAPTAVYDDGVHTYLKFPADVAHGPLPVLRAVSEAGVPALMNYSVEGDAFIVDGVIERAELLMGDDGGRRVEIVNTRSVATR
jgi:P-type conjugative transfer protein TrbG